MKWVAAAAASLVVAAVGAVLLTAWSEDGYAVPWLGMDVGTDAGWSDYRAMKGPRW